jgi:hypothetical protein
MSIQRKLEILDRRPECSFEPDCRIDQSVVKFGPLTLGCAPSTRHLFADSAGSAFLKLLPIERLPESGLNVSFSPLEHPEDG